MFDKLPIELIKIIISYCPNKIRYKFYDKYHLYSWITFNVDQYVKLEFVGYDCFNLLKHFGAPFDRSAMYYASLNGNLEMVKWLYSQGSDWHDKAFAAANAKGHSHISEWLYKYQPTSQDFY